MTHNRKTFGISAAVMTAIAIAVFAFLTIVGTGGGVADAAGANTTEQTAARTGATVTPTVQPLRIEPK